MPDTAVAGDTFEFMGLEHICHQSHTTVGSEHAVLAAHDSRAFLPAMLQGVQSEVNQF